jgi:hypothetical protein
MESGTSINHIAFIMDGNRRWAKKHNLPIAMGHRKGAETLTEIAKVAKADIVPVAIAEWTGYLKVFPIFPFKRQHVVIKVGKPISYKLSHEEIIYQWAQQISEMADYENCVPEPEAKVEEIIKA